MAVELQTEMLVMLLMLLLLRFSMSKDEYKGYLHNPAVSTSVSSENVIKPGRVFRDVVRD